MVYLTRPVPVAALGTMVQAPAAAVAPAPALVRVTLSTESPASRPMTVNSVPAKVTVSP